MNRNSAIMVKLSIYQWPGKVTDQKATETAHAVYHADANAGRYEKQLLPGALTLKAIQRLAAQIRNWHYQVTLPWENDGWRIIPSTRWMEYATELRAHRESWQSAVNTFIETYPNLIQLSRECLGELWNESEYPDPAEVELAFALDHRIQPIPNADDLRIEGDPAEAAAIQAETKTRLERAIIESQRDVVDRIKIALEAVVERLNDPDARFKRSLFENLSKLSTLIPRLMIEPDTRMEEAARKIALLGMIDADSVRESPDYRQQVASDASAILDSMVIAYGDAAHV